MVTPALNVTPPDILRDTCFRCGGKGHIAGSCFAPVKCLPCESEGVECDHRFGSLSCRYKSDGAVTSKKVARRAEDIELTSNG